MGVVSRIGLAYHLREGFDSRGNRHTLIKSVARTLSTHAEFGIGPNNPTADCEPIYPVLIAVCCRTFGELGLQWLGVCLVQTALFLASATAVARITFLLSGSRFAANLAFGAVFLYPFYVTQSVSIVDTSLACYGLSTVVLRWVRAEATPTVNTVTLLGVAYGCCLLVRFGNICLLPFILWTVMGATPKGRKLSMGLLVLVAAGAVVCPWCARNYHLSGRPAVTTHGAIEVWLGFNAQTRAHMESRTSVDRMRPARYELVNGLRELGTFDTAISREVAEARLYLAAALLYARENPWDCIGTCADKFECFWTWELNPRSDARFFKVWSLIYAVSYIPILCMGLLGIATLAYRRGGMSAPLWVIFAYTLMHSVVFGFTRLRLPMDQMLMVFGSQLVAIVHARRDIMSSKR